MVLSGIATNQIHPKKAGRMLSALRLAAAELRRTSKE
jgi:hypothetical protein